MFTEDMYFNNVEFIEQDCDHARVEPSTEDEEEGQSVDSELMDLVGEDSIVENQENDSMTNNVHDETDMNCNLNLSNEVMAAGPDTSTSSTCVTNELDYNANLANENVAVDDVNAEELSLRGISRMQFTIEKHTCYNEHINNIESPPFMCRKLPFHLLVSIAKRDTDEKLSIYLKRGTPNGYDISYENGYSHEDGLMIMASVSICVQLKSGLIVEKSFENHLFPNKSDWGFSEFMSVKETGVNDAIIISVNVTAHPPFCYNYHSREITGYVGIKNQGATCYMNSLLEVLFFLTKFRTACFRIPTEMDDYSSMALALQKVFYNLQFSKLPVSTINLTKSFGWTTVDALMQHDIQELMRVLIDKIESRMKNSLLQDIVPSMFQGAFISYVKCRDVEFTSQRQEIFYDIQLSLENANNVLDAFKQYVTPEIMDNDNKYDAGTFGLQTAEKGTIFTKLPPVLFLHLLRFQFDGTLNMAVKNNNLFEFYGHIDLTEYVRSDESKPFKYSLFAVLAHSGGGSHGHYVAYVNPNLDGNWLKFDDEIISFVHSYDAINENFGSDDKDEWTKSQHANAYMLVYVRDSDAREILEPVDPRYITDELKIAVKTDGFNDENEWCGSFTVDVHAFLDTHLESEIRFDGTSYLRKETDCGLPKFIIQKDISAHKFRSILMDSFKLSNVNQLRIWPIYHSSSNPYPSYPIYLNNDENNTSILSAFRDKHRFWPTVWIEIALPGCELPSFDPDKEALIFYYVYCASKSCTYYIDHGYHDSMSQVAELVPKLNNFMEWPNDQELNIYEDLGRATIRELNMSDVLMNGINSRFGTHVMSIIFEPKEHDTSMSALFPTISLFYEDIRNRVSITIWNADDTKVDDITLEVSVNTTFPHLVDLLAQKLNHDREKIQLLTKGDYLVGDAIPSTSTETLSTILNKSSVREPLLFYKLLRVKVIDMENKIPFHFRWLSIDMKKMEKHTLYITNETIEEILAEAEKLIQCDVTDGSGKLRLLRVQDNKVKVLNETQQIYQYLKPKNNKSHFRIEEIPKEDETLSLNEMFVMVFHSSINNKKKGFLGHSFIFKIKSNEQWQDIKERLRLRLKLSEAMWKDYRPIIFESEDEYQDLAMKDMECIDDIDPNTIKKYIIRLDHKNNKANEEASHMKFAEKSITIND